MSKLHTAPPVPGALESAGYAPDSGGVWSRPGGEALPYSDGSETELRIQRAIAACSDRSVLSMELRGHIVDWPSRYHLSPVRANLLRPLTDLLRGKEVLEIGAGCGAVSRFVGECGAASLVALEGSPARARCAALRCADLANVSVVADRLQSFACERSFDVVTLVGVLEYARIFFRTGEEGDPIDHMLRKARSLLRPDGLLVVAIENQLGLKYYCGYGEDHVTEPYFGIEDGYDASTVATFGRRELGARIAACGLPEQRWLFPFPDYKLPCAILDQRLTDTPEIADLSPVLQGSVLADPQFPMRNLFSLEQAWVPVFRNGLAGELANSFLVLAAAQPGAQMGEDFLALIYSAERRPEFAKRTAIVQQEGVVRVLPERFRQGGPAAAVEGLEQRLSPSDLVDGRLWHGELVRRLARDGWTLDGVTNWMERWIEALPERPPGLAPQDWVLPEDHWDAIPRNLIVREGEACFIDLEWHRPIPLRFPVLAYRALVLSLLAVRSVGRPADPASLELRALVAGVFGRIGLDACDAELAVLHAEEQQFQQLVNGLEWVGFDAIRAYHLPQVEPRIAGA